MKTLNVFMLAFVCSLGFFACEPAEVAPVKMGTSGHASDIGGFVPNPSSTVQPEKFDRLPFPRAKGWNILWRIQSNEPDVFPGLNDAYWDNCAGFLSTTDGALYSLNQLNSTGRAATAKTDMYLPIGSLRSPHHFPLVHLAYARITRFKPSNLTPDEAMKIAQHRPEEFTEAYQLNPANIHSIVPFVPGAPDAQYKKDEVYVFETGTQPPMYGAVIINDAPPNTVELTVLVQK